MYLLLMDCKEQRKNNNLTIQLKYYDFFCYVMGIDYDIEMQNIFTNFEIKKVCSDLLQM
jgi:hypothetical protein